MSAPAADTLRRPARRRLQGALTIARAASVRSELLGWIKGDGDVDLDLSGVTEADTIGVQLILSAQRSAAAAGVTWRLQNPSEALCIQAAAVGVSAALLAPSHP